MSFMVGFFHFFLLNFFFYLGTNASTKDTLGHLFWVLGMNFVTGIVFY